MFGAFPTRVLVAGAAKARTAPKRMAETTLKSRMVVNNNQLLRVNWRYLFRTGIN